MNRPDEVLMMNRPDEVLIRHAKAGDQGAFAILFLRYGGEIYACLMKAVCNDDIARDLLHDTYVKAWLHIQKLKEPLRFKAWLHTIARNLAFDWLRQNHRERIVPLETNESTHDPIHHGDSPEAVIERDFVQCVLAKMEPVLREVLILSATGYSRAEIAQHLGYAESTVTTYMANARKQFRQLYHEMNKTNETRKEK